MDKYWFFDQQIYLDSDILWCKHPNVLWKAFEPHNICAIGHPKAGGTFGYCYGKEYISNILLFKRKRTLRKFNLKGIPRISAIAIFSKNRDITASACQQARWFFTQKHLTHFNGGKNIRIDNEESCEWSMAMAWAKFHLSVIKFVQKDIVYISNYIPSKWQYCSKVNIKNQIKVPLFFPSFF